ncbi:transposase [Spirillospora sp. NPDC048824]|uniref:transposase n=1 Tax=Spirillospora sp. NPDC048824 TaxID=3364526 RepID=UPI0037211841
MDTERRSFDPEFRAGAVRIVQETGRPVAQVARDLGINQYTLHNWVKKDRLAGSGGNGGGALSKSSKGSGLSESEREELARLRRQKAEMARRHAEERAAWEAERAQLEMERDVLKRSVVLWVKEAEGR